MNLVKVMSTIIQCERFVGKYEKKSSWAQYPFPNMVASVAIASVMNICAAVAKFSVSETAKNLR
jgi:hypothetical protein